MGDRFDADPTIGQSQGAGTAARMKQSAMEAAAEASEKISDLGRRTVDQLDSAREPIASTLDRTASTLHEKGDTAAKVAHFTADRVQSTADYVRQNDVQSMMGDVRDFASRYPGQCFAIAVGIGFLLGRFFSDTD